MLRAILSLSVALSTLCVSLPLTANAAQPTGFILVAADGVSVSDAWARATPGGAASGAAYLMLMGGDKADALTGASTPVATTAELHQTISDQGVMKMRPVASVAIPAGGMVTFKPGGYHVMLSGLKNPLVAGQTFPLTLTFQHAAPVTVTVTIRATGSGAPAMDHMHM